MSTIKTEIVRNNDKLWAVHYSYEMGVGVGTARIRVPLPAMVDDLVALAKASGHTLDSLTERIESSWMSEAVVE